MVAIGDNGLGKSTILKASQVALGGLIQSIPSLPARPVFRRQFRPNEIFRKYNPITKSEDTNPENTQISCIALTYQNNIISWKRVYLNGRETSHNSKDSAEIIKFGTDLFTHYNSKGKPLVVLANFTAQRSDSEVNFSAKTWDGLSKLEKGYYCSLFDKTAFEPVIIWLSLYDSMLKAGMEFENTRTAFFETVKTAFGGYLLELEFIPSIGFYLTLDFKDGAIVPPKRLDICSDGVITFFRMVAEIAWRCVTLNGHLGLDSIKKSPGIVLIDEIDIMLHPNWQRHVVPDLQRAFPNIQFIATTHSPFIVQSLSGSQLIILRQNGVIETPSENPYSYPLNVVGYSFMGVESDKSQLMANLN